MRMRLKVHANATITWIENTYQWISWVIFVFVSTHCFHSLVLVSDHYHITFAWLRVFHFFSVQFLHVSTRAHTLTSIFHTFHILEITHTLNYSQICVYVLELLSLTSFTQNHTKYIFIVRATHVLATDVFVFTQMIRLVKYSCVLTADCNCILSCVLGFAICISDCDSKWH